MEEFTLTFQNSWLKDETMLLEEYSNEYKLKILEDLGDCYAWIENDEGVLEWTKVHKYKVEKID